MSRGHTIHGRHLGNFYDKRVAMHEHIYEIPLLSHSPVVLGISRRTGGAESLTMSSFSMGSSSLPTLEPPVQVTPSIHLRASGPSLRIKACSSFSFSISAFRNRQFVFFTSRNRCSSSHTEESRRPFLDMGLNVALTRLSTTPWGFRFSSTNCKTIRMNINQRLYYAVNI